MWQIREVKGYSKARFLANYWKCVLAGLILMIAMGSGSQLTYRFNSTFSGTHKILNHQGDINEVERVVGSITRNYNADADITAAGIVAIILLITTIVMLAASLGFVLKIFVLNPLQVSARRYYLRNNNENAMTIEGLWAFNAGYKHIVWVMFLRDLYVFLWGLLFVIPGIVKGYEYRMIPYLLAEAPDMSAAEAFARTRAIMNGNKGQTFLLDLSFIGWDILSGFTAGILGIFFVNPYRNQTHSVLYEVLAGPAPEAPKHTAQTYSAPQGNSQTYGAPQYSAPQSNAQTYSAPQYSAPQSNAQTYSAPEASKPMGQNYYDPNTGEYIGPDRK